MAKKVVIDKGSCVGCGACTGIAEGVIALGDDGLAEGVAEVTAENESSVEEAAASCPVGAITIE